MQDILGELENIMEKAASQMMRTPIQSTAGETITPIKLHELVATLGSLNYKSSKGGGLTETPVEKAIEKRLKSYSKALQDVEEGPNTSPFYKALEQTKEQIFTKINEPLSNLEKEIKEAEEAEKAIESQLTGASQYYQANAFFDQGSELTNQEKERIRLEVAGIKRFKKDFNEAPTQLIKQMKHALARGLDVVLKKSMKQFDAYADQLEQEANAETQKIMTQPISEIDGMTLQEIARRIEAGAANGTETIKPIHGESFKKILEEIPKSAQKAKESIEKGLTFNNLVAVKQKLDECIEIITGLKLNDLEDKSKEINTSLDTLDLKLEKAISAVENIVNTPNAAIESLKASAAAAGKAAEGVDGPATTRSKAGKGEARPNHLQKGPSPTNVAEAPQPGSSRR